MSERVEVRHCLCCVHCMVSLGEAGYSEYTPSTAGYIGCDKGHFNFRRSYSDIVMRKTLNNSAETCKDFTYEP